jgi:GAF domain-containing protein
MAATPLPWAATSREWPRGGAAWIAEMLLAIRDTADLGTACGIAGRAAVQALGAREYRLLRLDADSGALRCLDELGIETPCVAERSGPVERVLISEAPVFDDGGAALPREDALWAEPARALLALPLAAGGTLRGILLLAFATPRRWDAADTALTLGIAGALALALERAELGHALGRARRRIAELEGRAAGGSGPAPEAAATPDPAAELGRAPAPPEDALEAIRGMFALRRGGLIGGREVVQHVRELARALGLAPAEVDLLGYVAGIHDLGMVRLGEEIEAPGALDEPALRALDRHPEVSLEILRPFGYLERVGDVILSHHERWDGSGYPRGLAGEAIPLGSRILAVADAWDSMVRGRPYRPPLQRGEARDELRAHAGTQFDPRVVDAFLALPAVAEVAA